MYIRSEEIKLITYLKPGSRYDKTYENKDRMTIWKVMDDTYTYSYRHYRGDTVAKNDISLEILLKDWFYLTEVATKNIALNGRKRYAKKRSHGIA